TTVLSSLSLHDALPISSRFVLHLELAEAIQRDLFTLRGRLGDTLQHIFDDGFRLGLRQSVCFSHALREVDRIYSHSSVLSAFDVSMSPTVDDSFYTRIVSRETTQDQPVRRADLRMQKVVPQVFVRLERCTHLAPPISTRQTQNAICI